MTADLPRRPWRVVMGFAYNWPFQPTAVNANRRIIRDRWRDLANVWHPALKGGCPIRYAEIEAARDQALKAVS